MSKFILYLKSGSFKKNLIAALIIILILFLGVYFGLQSYTKHGDSIEVPTVKGIHIDEAKRLLERSDLEYAIDSVYQMDATPGTVIEQDPEAKSHVKTGRTIYLTVITETPPQIAFPAIIDKTLIEASAILRNQSLKVRDTIYISDIARDVVLDVQFEGQPLNAGRMIAKGSGVTLVLGNGRGANEVEMPDLVGLTLEEAKFSLQGLGLVLGKVSFTGTDSLSAKITHQYPEVSTGIVSVGTLVDLTITN